MVLGLLNYRDLEGWENLSVYSICKGEELKSVIGIALCFEDPFRPRRSDMSLARYRGIVRS